MGWRIEFSGGARKALDHLDPQAARRVLRCLRDRIDGADDPRLLGKPLKGSKLGDLWRYRVGDYRIIADLRDNVMIVLVLRVAHRSEVYR